ncbi:MAG TPA: sigma 54-interacting transcriptional regulator [Kofleriaceae bacterium]|nr:sigma 54-interacting transcriptional regulator [Kofleriaceae bacterium]
MTVRTRETDVVAGEHHALVQQFQLAVIGGADEGKRFDSAGERMTIGSDPGAQLTLADRAVSRFHAEIEVVGGRAIVRDLDSRNGVVVDGVPVLQAVLRDGAILAIGRTQLRFQLGAEPVRIPLSSRERFGVMVGRSPAMRAVFSVLERAAQSDATVLLEGETGTGKEAAAESLHRESARRDAPLIVVDCGAIPPGLLESELFGHERGAFTGAVAEHEGALEAAHRGTVFLDEIGELALELQPRLLRALDRREIKRVGASRYRPIDVRVIAATHRNLRAEVNAGRFRADLYYRLAVLQVRLPPLRQRADDLPLLIEHVLHGLGAADSDAAALVRTREFMADLARHAWPGNVRELRNYIERCLALRDPGAAPPLPAADAPAVDLERPLRAARDEHLRAFERAYLQQALAAAGNNVTAAARIAGIDRIYFYRLLWKYGLR